MTRLAIKHIAIETYWSVPGLRSETNLVTKPLRGYDGNFVTNTLVRLEVEGEFRVIALDNDLCGFLDGLRIAVNISI